MYVTLYDGSIHPGINMLLGMGKLVGTNDPERIAAAGREIQGWAEEANIKIVQLISEVRIHQTYPCVMGSDHTASANARERGRHPESLTGVGALPGRHSAALRKA